MKRKNFIKQGALILSGILIVPELVVFNNLQLKQIKKQ